MQINVVEYLERGALARCPDKIAVIGPDATLSFAQLSRAALRCARAIVDRADAVNQVVAVFLPKSAAAAVADLGIVYSGNIYTNLDVKSPAQRIRNILENLEPALVITSRELEAALAALGVPGERTLLVDEAIVDGAEIDGASLRARLERVIDTDPLCIINTSGSTGTPKGVALSHRSTIDFMDWCFDVLGLGGDERIGSLSPFHFDIYTLELNACLARGATMVLIPDQLAVFPAKLLEFLSQQKVSFIFWVPSIMVNISNQGLLDKFDLSALRTVYFAGEVFPTRHFNRWRRALPQAKFVNLYGPIEITVDCTYYVVDREFADDEPLPIGRPCRNTDVLILNGRDEPCRDGEVGELCVRGGSLALGYWNDPEKTASAFVQNPLQSKYPERIYRTGDLVSRNDRGEIVFLGRRDFQIKHMGYRIELPEIEHQVLCLPGIANACVLYNHEKKEITLFFESPGGAATPAAIRQQLSALFPKYMLPTAFHCLDELPRNPNGKIDRNRLAERLRSAAG
jgi:D-alanine--poly(phosphoribitol) ligase subunit 1